MALKRGKRRKEHSDAPTVVANTRTSCVAGWFYPFTLGALLVGGLVYAAMVESPSESEFDPSITTLARNNSRQNLPSLGELAMMSEKELAKQDIALMNLRCAEGLPGSKNLDIEKCLETLDQWAARVKHETARHLYKYRESPEEFENSEAFYRMMMLFTVLQQDYKVHYNPDRIRDVDFTKSEDLFIHGMINNGNGGTCVSMPVLYTTVARRLGYPVYLVTANAHVFCRWEDSKERFNIEATSQGMSSYDDEYYMKWPKPITAAQIKAGWYLKSLSNATSFASFLATRGHCLEDNKFGAKARVAYALAAEKTPQHPLYYGFLAQTMRPRQRRANLAPQVYPLDPAWNQQPIDDPLATSNAHQPWGQPRRVPHNTFKPVTPFSTNQYGLPQTRSTSFPNPNAGYGLQP